MITSSCRSRSRLLWVASIATVAASVWTSSACADLVGATVTGDLRYPIALGVYNAENLFDPANGVVPAGFGNSASPTIVLAGAGLDNFAYLLGGGTVANPVIDSWFAQFIGTQLSVTFRNFNYFGPLTGTRMTFTSDVFVGFTLQQVGADAFLPAGNGPMTATLDGDTITLTVAPHCIVGPGCPWPRDTYTNTYALVPLAVPVSLTLRTGVVAGCKSVVGTVTLDVPAPASGAIVTLSDTLASATTPASMTIPAGALSGKFTIKTLAVPGPEGGVVRATLAGTTLEQPLTVRPMGLSSLTVKPSSIAGGNTAIGKAKLECKASPGPITVELSSDNPAVAAPVAANLVVPQGIQTVEFDVGTSQVLSASSARITASANDIEKSKVLKVLPAASVSPTSLKFGNQVLGTTSAKLNTTLTNKGTASFAVMSIGLTGTYASWFAQTNNCPANLAPGASCTIGVTFTPAAAAKKSAKLSIATSATATPLSVSLSGTGVPP